MSASTTSQLLQIEAQGVDSNKLETLAREQIDQIEPSLRSAIWGNAIGRADIEAYMPWVNECPDIFPLATLRINNEFIAQPLGETIDTREAVVLNAYKYCLLLDKVCDGYSPVDVVAVMMAARNYLSTQEGITDELHEQLAELVSQSVDKTITKFLDRFGGNDSNCMLALRTEAALINSSLARCNNEKSHLYVDKAFSYLMEVYNTKSSKVGRAFPYLLNRLGSDNAGILPNTERSVLQYYAGNLPPQDRIYVIANWVESGFINVADLKDSDLVEGIDYDLASVLDDISRERMLLDLPDIRRKLDIKNIHDRLQTVAKQKDNSRKLSLIYSMIANPRPFIGNIATQVKLGVSDTPKREPVRHVVRLADIVFNGVQVNPDSPILNRVIDPSEAIELYRHFIQSNNWPVAEAAVSAMYWQFFLNEGKPLQRYSELYPSKARDTILMLQMMATTVKEMSSETSKPLKWMKPAFSEIISAITTQSEHVLRSTRLGEHSEQTLYDFVTRMKEDFDK